MFDWASTWLDSIHEPLFSTLDLIVVSWVMMSTLVGYCASAERNRSFLAWYLASLVSSPFLAAFLLLKSPKEPNPPTPGRPPLPPAEDSKPDGVPADGDGPPASAKDRAPGPFSTLSVRSRSR